MEKQDLASARRRMRSTNIKSRKRALKVLHDYRRQLQKAK
ncbi:putative metal homeostasis protein [Lactiplantibacillus sp. WILCCON 0030]|uniref:Metal homeostasis protein n=1 Tax=Lactiplantibacillus brownii TaxID=3069269 RepID=A0ABU1A7D5_9LACO|nr:putative metal homeostasis protein [Lactiplantibacillus brownii]MDQ7936778.1 putative metal homeostasis protein [Lactiplantibacillus brownii]